MTDLKKAQDELAEAKDKYIRLYSEFENFRRRTAKEKLELISFILVQLIYIPLESRKEILKADSKLRILNSNLINKWRQQS